ncbi:hypothetical protein [Spirosoma utsteinense]|uniref:Uncharacterized protein n=1 Tax=Spirosoma utsteinense TaxID=2585773 RepID=A0ABR6W320_9BACT|nr:hypothetical protein [Spirosoma utsteinense]MBC3784354.1 hypothetical protein [Spirosoma utsteinense]MBC3790847.1 hypothetical protein [Spirosoma utsteinense]
MNVFTENAGRFLNSKETASLTGSYRDRKLAVGLPADEYTRSEYFGIQQVMHLLSQPGCIGLRIHHAKRWEDADGNPTEEGKGQLKPRVLLTGVDSKGHDMPIRVDKAGLKDDGDDELQTVGDGYICPRHCPK